MIGISGTYFLLAENHLSAASIYFNQVFGMTEVFVSVAMYIWVGMLLKQTRLGELVFGIFTVRKLAPESLVFVAVIVMAIPTAYTGASGIIVLAMGAVVYEELRRAGTRRQLALAATAMTGSYGAVLKPCLLIVLIAIIDKQVATDELYSWGSKVFFLTLASLLFYTFLTRKAPLQKEGPSEEAGTLQEAFLSLAPYIIIITLLVLGYAFLLEAYIDEFNAYVILPVILIAVIGYERTNGLKNIHLKTIIAVLRLENHLVLPLMVRLFI